MEFFLKEPRKVSTLPQLFDLLLGKLFCDGADLWPKKTKRLEQKTINFLIIFLKHFMIHWNVSINRHCICYSDGGHLQLGINLELTKIQESQHESQN